MLLAQATPGTPPFSTQVAVPEGRIDLADLNVEITVPVVVKAGVGMPFAYALRYNSLIWTPDSPSGGYLWSPGPGGWTPSSPGFEFVGYAQPQRTVQIICPGINKRCVLYGNCTYYTEYSQWVYTDPAGTPHAINVAVYDYSACPSPGTGPYTATGPAADGSGWAVTVSAAPEGISATDITGRVYNLETENVTDPNGNKISCCFTDTLGQSALTYAVGQHPSDPTTYTYTDAAGNPETVTVQNAAYTVKTNFACNGVTESGPSSGYLISEIDLPDGSNYKFTYEPTPGYPGDVTGRLGSVQLPTGATISYQYSGITCADGTPSTLKRITPDGTWTYTHSESGSDWTTFVTDPAGNETEYQFQGLYETEREIYSGPMTQLLETVYTCYNGASFPCTGTAVTAPITERTTVIKRDDGLESETTTTFNAENLPLETDQYAYGSGAPGAVFRKTIITYQTGVPAADLPASVEVEDGAGTEQALTNFGYDTKGNLTSISRWVSGNTYDTTTYTVNANGTVATMTDPRGYATSFDYSGTSCNSAFPTTITLANGLATHAAWNCYVGKEATATDLNGQTTTFHYDDPFARLTQIDAPAGREAVIQYTSPTQTDRYISTTADSLPASDNGWRHERDIFDSLGREIEHDLVNDPAGLDKVLTTYNSLGFVASVTNRFRATSDPTYGVTDYSYGALGRLTSITNPNGSITHLDYGSAVSGASGLGSSACGDTAYPELAVSAAGRPSEVWLGADGNVLEADEPDPSTGSLTSGELATCYTYTTVGLLATVSQGGQQRSISYDGLGQMLYSRYPEAAATISGPADPFGSTHWSEALTYDADGDVATREDANGVTTTYAYDTIDRLTGESFSDGTTARFFNYDSTSGCTIPSGATISNPAGRLVCAGLSGTGQYTLFSYGPAGHVIETWEQGPSGGALSQIYSFFYNGQVKSYTNPNGNIFTYSIDNPGRISQITGNWNGNETVFGAAAFGPLGNLTSASVGPEAIGATYNGDAEMTETWASVSGTRLFDRGYSYDNDGLTTSDDDGINSAYNRNYAYDSLSRLTSMTAPNTPSANSAFTYDRWGNLYQATGSEDWNVGIDDATNRISTAGFTYDSDGRLTSDGSASFGWNALGQMTSFGSSSTYDYDALGRRVRAVTPAGTFEYYYGASGALRGVWDVTSGRWKQLEIGIGAGTLETYNAAPPAGYSNFTYTGSSLLGSVAFRYNPSAGGKNYHFLPYGLEWPGETPDATTNLKWTGHQYDSDSGLYHFLFRNYAPLENRWLSPDPAGWAVGNPVNPQSWNRYSYAAGSPCSLTDPLGLRWNPCNYDNPTNKRVIDFINNNLSPVEAAIQASGLDVNALFVLGLSGSESTYGTSLPAVGANNYFGVKAGHHDRHPFQPSGWKDRYRRFPGPGIGGSMAWFLPRYGPQVAGAPTAEQFTADLNKGPLHFNDTEKKFPSSTEAGISAILHRINCPAVKKNPSLGHPLPSTPGGRLGRLNAWFGAFGQANPWPIICVDCDAFMSCGRSSTNGGSWTPWACIWVSRNAAPAEPPRGKRRRRRS